MEPKNQTFATQFILLGFSTDLKLNMLFFILLLAIYLITCIGNFLIICIIIANPNLHTPMYFFICNLSILDLCYSSSCEPRLLSDMFSVQSIISFKACGFQVYASLFLGGTECLLLSLMAYDRYLAICRPLYYSVLMSWNCCIKLIVMVWLGSFIISVVPTLAMPLALCNPNQINHFMCDILAVQKLVCEHNLLGELLIFLLSFILIFLPFILILVSYLCVICSILKLSNAGKGKAFSTCTSHLTVVLLFYGSIMIIHGGSMSKYLLKKQKYISVIYVVITPMLNPMIDSLKNKEVKATVNKFLGTLKLKIYLKL